MSEIVKNRSTHTTTTFQMSRHLHAKLRMMCLLTHKSMGEFIRLAIVDKINALEVGRKDENG